VLPDSTEIWLAVRCARNGTREWLKALSPRGEGKGRGKK